MKALNLAKIHHISLQCLNADKELVVLEGHVAEHKNRTFSAVWNSDGQWVHCACNHGGGNPNEVYPQRRLLWQALGDVAADVEEGLDDWTVLSVQRAGVKEV